MSGYDERACPVSGATPAAAQAYERALAAFQGWRGGADEHLATALREAPRFAMARVLQAYLLVCSRDPRRVRSAQHVLAHTAGIETNRRERLHLAALTAVLADDYEGAKARLGELLNLHPRDVLALQVAHAFDYVTGDAVRMLERVVAVLPAWDASLPGYHSVLAMHAFALVECGEFEHAEAVARAALAHNPFDARAHHVMAHVFEMTARPDAGLRWMSEHLTGWGADGTAVTHCWWHVALFHLAQGRSDRALTVYDRHVRSSQSSEVADLIDASSLLWRIQLHGGDAGARWTELAAAWAPHIDDAFCSFNDVHAMLAFVGARDWKRAQRLESKLARSQTQRTRHGATTRRLGLSACRALIAFGRGNYTLATTLLASLAPSAHPLGGSHAQRDVLHLTLQRAIDEFRRPARSPRGVSLATAAPARPGVDSAALERRSSSHAALTEGSAP
jgi:tetratricopeptide (TPR) repeat protein